MIQNYSEPTLDFLELIVFNSPLLNTVNEKPCQTLFQ